MPQRGARLPRVKMKPAAVKGTGRGRGAGRSLAAVNVRMPRSLQWLPHSTGVSSVTPRSGRSGG